MANFLENIKIGSTMILVFLSSIGLSTIFFSQTIIAQTQTNSSLPPSQDQLYTTMVEISNSDKPEDIATLAYLWGYSLITV